jgi:hypothetical protein
MCFARLYLMTTVCDNLCAIKHCSTSPSSIMITSGRGQSTARCLSPFRALWRLTVRNYCLPGIQNCQVAAATYAMICHCREICSVGQGGRLRQAVARPCFRCHGLPRVSETWDGQRAHAFVGANNRRVSYRRGSCSAAVYGASDHAHSFTSICA